MTFMSGRASRSTVRLSEGRQGPVAQRLGEIVRLSDNGVMHFVAAHDVDSRSRLHRTGGSVVHVVSERGEVGRCQRAAGRGCGYDAS